MKKLSFLFIAFALVAFVSLNSCKTSTEPATDAEEAVVEEVVEEAVEVVDTLAVEATEEEAPVEEAAE